MTSTKRSLGEAALAVEAEITRKLVKRGHLLFALIDSENVNDIKPLMRELESCDIDSVLVGGSTIADQVHLDIIVRSIKSLTTLPVILFPGNITGISRHADAIFFSSLLNSDDPYFLIGAQAIASFTIWKYKLEAIPMAYIIAGEGVAAGFVGRARTFPPNKPELITSYALAAGYLGMRFLYLEAGSGAHNTVSSNIIRSVKSHYKGTLIVGGGIRNPKIARTMVEAGADILVVGNLLETNGFTSTLKQISKVVHSTGP